MKFRSSALLLLACALSRGDVASVMAEANLEKRSALALDEADNQIDAARKAYSASKFDDFKKDIQTAGDMAELSYQSLQETGKKARRSPKWFKRAEQRLQVLLRRADSLSRDVSFEDRDTVDALKKRVTAVHDQVLHDIMWKK